MRHERDRSEVFAMPVMSLVSSFDPVSQKPSREASAWRPCERGSLLCASNLGKRRPLEGG
jgi:hypothetical protein